MGTKRILIVDDEENIGRSLQWILEGDGCTVTVCRSAAEFQSAGNRFDLYLLDVRLPDGNGIDLLRQIRQQGSQSPVIMISGHGTIAMAVEAVRLGAFDFLEKPLARERVLLAVQHALDRSKLERENQSLREIVGAAPRMIGDSAAFRAVVEQATLAARSDARVLLIGESGTGKELLAAHIHDHSPFTQGTFVKVNCAAIPSELIESELFGHEKGSFTGATGLRRGKFELADGGTLFLDEVGDLQQASQAKLLRVLQEGEFHRVGGEKPIRVSVRIVAATNRNLEDMVEKEKFREDLYYRLSVVPIRLPALRERPSDIRALAGYFLDEFCTRNNFRRKCLEEETYSMLEQYHWPGNARELRNAVERMAILCPTDSIPCAAIPAEIRIGRAAGPRSSLQEARESAEREHILRALEQANWNVSGAARTLGMERTNLHKRMRSLGLRRETV
ncbi:MAG: sigma-54-dependent Fis family transcriptional regulator [Acidobacteria bacterium]|nr:sigma-54-dependent Fis family transcriptional regulator [Acidobacteriota bacterium]